MKISNNNNLHFNGLNLVKTSDFHLKHYVIPELKNLKKLSQKADIFLCSRWNMALNAPVFEFAVRKIGDKDVLRWANIGTGYNIYTPKTMTKKIKAGIKKLNRPKVLTFLYNLGNFIHVSFLSKYAKSVIKNR